MSDRRANPHARHCPFVNRTDTRCGSHFGLDGMAYVLDHCFGSYEACPVYKQMYDERLTRRAVAAEHHADLQFVQISFPDRYQKPAA